LRCRASKLAFTESFEYLSYAALLLRLVSVHASLAHTDLAFVPGRTHLFA
jgi:hypothetical protein